MGRDRQSGPSTGGERRRVPVARGIALATLIASSVLLFLRLGAYSLWEDEAITALHAQGVWETGDTTAVIGHNVVGYRAGAPLVGLRERYMAPLPSYMAAPFVGLLGRDPLAARLPFALCGLACVAVMLGFAARIRSDCATRVLLAIAILGNASFFLFSRQCRYYGVAILATTIGALGYVRLLAAGKKGALLAACVVLCAANYLNYASFVVAIAVDYAVWGRRARRLSWGEWCMLVVPQVVAATALLSVWNPLGKEVVDYVPYDWLGERVVLFWWNVRDLNACEFGVLPLLAAGPMIAWRAARSPSPRSEGTVAGSPPPPAGIALLVRGPIALLVYVATITVASPQPVGATTVADIRYLAPVIPLCIAVGVLALRVAMPAAPRAAIALGLLVFGTNLAHGGLFAPRGLHSTIARFVRELVWHPGDPYGPVARWIERSVPEGRSILVLPDNMTYPLMYHAPGAVYAWQFNGPPEGLDQRLGPIHFQGVVPPDYLVSFGLPAPGGEGMVYLRGRDGDAGDWRRDYRRLTTIAHYWKDRHRPELFWRSFEPVTNYRASEKIFIYQRVDSEAGPKPARQVATARGGS